MFQEAIAAYTADHLNTHIKDYLEAINNSFTPVNREVVRNPIQISTDSMAGGVMAVELNKLPAYAVDCLDKTAIEVTEDVYTYQYVGHIAGVVTSRNKKSVNQLVKRHASAVEFFVKHHELLHQYSTNDFTILRCFFTGSAFSGAELESEGNQQVWVAGFRIDLAWITSEDGPVQH